MDDPDELAPAVRSILSAARERSGRRGEAESGVEAAESKSEVGDDAEIGVDDGAEPESVDVDPRDLTAAFDRAESDGRVPIVAEVKPTSPTTEGTREDDPVELAEAMVAGGAAALSVLTEPAHFGGSVDTLERVREAVDVPVLRKDFLLREEQLDAVESDVVLLIARFVGDDLAELLAAARDRGFQVLVEVHDREELDRAIDAGADVIGVNNRDLSKLQVDLGTFESVAPHVPDEVTLIAESGVSTPADVRRMRAAGADALLVGSAIMAGDVEANTRELTRAADDEGPTDETPTDDAPTRDTTPT
ncbi:indole-3-glycerol phosphate synthase [Halorubrum sp. DTA98]|uniref:indole-3-glycerol phosphate synthase n=1 Tax=Halorubrum sp. DTA98 TaxID=3402163 RepID=UPI003AAA4EED